MINASNYKDAEGNEAYPEWLRSLLETAAEDDYEVSLTLEPFEWRFILDCVKDATTEIL